MSEETNQAAPQEDAELMFTLQLDFPKEAVFKAWSQAEALQKWFVPQGFSVESCEVDFKEGGHFKLMLKDESGQVYPTAGEYRQIIENQRIAYLDQWDDDREQIPMMNVLIFDDLEEGKSRLSLFSVFSSPEHKEEVLAQGEREGWYLFMENLNQHLSNIA